MSKRNSVRCPLRSDAAGFSLIELMVALVLGLLVAGAALAILQSNQATYRTNEGLNRVQENARIAFELMSRDIRSAGGSACSRFSAVEGASFQATSLNTAPLAGTATTLRVFAGDDTAYRVTATTSTSVTLNNQDITDATRAFSVGDMIVLCNSSRTHVVTATGVNASTVTFAALPDYPVNDAALLPSVTMARFRDVNWFVAASGGGRAGNSLYMSRMGGAAEEVIDGVQAIAFQYLQRGAANYANVAGDDVVAVRIILTLRGVGDDGAAITRQVSNVVNLRARTL